MGYNMDTDLKDPRGKIRCIQQARNEKIQKAEEIVTKYIEQMEAKGLKPIDEHKKLLKELRVNDEKEVKEK